MSLSQIKDHYDVIVVGGGINGVGIARDCALRGMTCLVVEKNDFSAGTSGASSGMIHGGPRYMLNDIDVTRLACLDSGYIQKAAPHLLFRIPFLYPIYQKPNASSLPTKLLLESVDSFFSAYDRFASLKNGLPHTRMSAEEAVALEPNLPREHLLGAVSFDEWGIDVPRLCLANVMDAIDHGASAVNHTEVIKIHFENASFASVTLKDQKTLAEKKVAGKILVNATGPWSMGFAKRMGLTVKLRPGKGIHLVYDRRLLNMAIATQAMDGREMFIMPYENNTIIATTDDDFFGDLDQQQATEDEIKYLQEAIVQIFPQITKARLIYTYSGVRPTLYARNANESELSREHEIIHHKNVDGKANVYSLTGGKLASYRIMAEELVDVIAKELGNTTPCSTRHKPLPGGGSLPDLNELQKKYSLDAYALSRLVYRHGNRAEMILQKIKDNPVLGNFVCASEPVTIAEFQHSLENEGARSLSDVRRRTRWSQGPCQGLDCLTGGMSLFLRAFPETNVTQEWQQFLNEWWWNRACILAESQLKQEEILQAFLYCNNSLHRH